MCSYTYHTHTYFKIYIPYISYIPCRHTNHIDTQIHTQTQFTYPYVKYIHIYIRIARHLDGHPDGHTTQAYKYTYAYIRIHMQMQLYIYTTHIYTCMGNKKEHVSNHLLFLHPLRTIPLIELQIFSLRQTLQRPKIKQKPRASTAHSVERKLAAVACYHAKASRIPVRPFLLYVCAVLLP